MRNLSNLFLVNMPQLNQDPIFGHSLIYICDHDRFGTMGLIINKPFNKNESKTILNEIGMSQSQLNSDVYFGGPVSPDKGFILHDGKCNEDGAPEVSEIASISSSNKMLTDINNGEGPDNFRLIMGYSGWEPGQLESELENGDWMLLPSSENIIFSNKTQDQWNVAISKLDVNINKFTGQSGIA